MAILDAFTLFSGTISNGVIAGQTVTGTNTSVVSTNSIDTQSGLTANTGGQSIDLGKGTEAFISFVVTTAFAGLTSLAYEFISADDGALTTNVTVHRSTGPILLASLTAGATLSMPIPKNELRGALRRYVGTRYTIVGTGSAGAVAAVITTIPGEVPMAFYRSGFAIL